MGQLGWENHPKTVRCCFEGIFWGLYSNLLLETGLWLCQVRSAMVLGNEVLKTSKIRDSSRSMNNLFQCCTTLLVNISFPNVHPERPKLQLKSITACFITSCCKEECGPSAFNCHLYSCRLMLDHLFARPTKSSSLHMPWVPDHLCCSLLDPLQFLHVPFNSGTHICTQIHQ